MILEIALQILKHINLSTVCLPQLKEVGITLQLGTYLLVRFCHR